MLIIIGLLIVIILLMTKTGKSCLSGLIGLVSITVILFCYEMNCGSSNTKKEMFTSNEQSVMTQNISVVLSKTDSTQLLSQLMEINKRLEELAVIPEKARKQCDKFMRLYVNGEVTDNDLYRAAEIAKEKCGDRSYKIPNIEIPEKLPLHLKDTLNMALSNISTYYSSMMNAYEIVMGIADNRGNPSDANNYHKEVAIANDLYRQGMLYLWSVEWNMGMRKKRKK